ncbi:MAG: hypothetical protein IT559_07835 [Alphaproteobacteria bacterium]|nr:hypothetical protein [Alphaproteobacteria bacterium]
MAHSQNNSIQTKPSDSLSLTNQFKTRVAIEFHMRDVTGPAKLNVPDTFLKAGEIAEFAAGAKALKVTHKYPYWPSNPFYSIDNSEKGDRTFNKKFGETMLDHYRFFRQSQAFIESTPSLMMVLDKNLEESIDALSEEMQGKITGAPSAVNAIKNKNAAKMRSLEMFKRDFENLPDILRKWGQHYKSRSEDVLSVLYKMKNSKNISPEFRLEIVGGIKVIDEDYELYKEGYAEQVSDISQEDDLKDPEAIFAYFLDMWEGAVERSTHTLKNEIKMASLCMAFMGTYGKNMDIGLFDKQKSFEALSSNVQDQVNFVEDMIRSYKEACLNEQSLLFTGEFHTPAVPGMDYTVIAQEAKPDA